MPRRRFDRNGIVIPSLFCWGLALASSGPAVAQQAPREVRIGVVTDGPTERDAPIERAFRREIQALLGGEFAVSDIVIDGDWTVPGTERALRQQLADPSIDIVIAAGLTASTIAIQSRDLPKPVIAPYVIDAVGLGAPFDEGVSAVPNLVYVTYPPAFRSNLMTFLELAPVTRITGIRAPLPEPAAGVLDSNVRNVGRELGLDVEVIVAANTAAETLAQLSDDTQAVYVGALLNMSDEEIRVLATGLIERRIPSFSAFATDVDLGILASNATSLDVDRLARRVAILLQRILLGENAGALPVTFERRHRLRINMATARAIGVFPSFAAEADAVLLYPDRQVVQRVESLDGVVRKAMSGNLDLQAFEYSVSAGGESVREAKAGLLPQLDISALAVTIDEDRGSVLQSQHSGFASVGVSQLLYSDRAWANLDVQKHTQAARGHALDELRLDVTLAATRAYLNLLSAKTVERISRENLQLTRENLERAKTRLQVGIANRSELYRWESELAGDRAQVIDTAATRNVAEIELNRILNYPLEDHFLTREIGIEDGSLITSDPRLMSYLRDRWVFRVFRAFNVLRAFENSPELKQIDAGIRAAERVAESAKRAFFVPDVALDARVDNHFYEGGAGSGEPRRFDSWDWQVGIQASLPLFTSGARSATRSRAQLEVDQLRTERPATQQRIEQRVRSVMHRAGSSYAGIELARQAAEASRKGLELVSDSYAGGALSIIDLLDAQNTAFVAELAAANALYRFILDLLEAERAVGKFDFFATAQEREAYFRDLEAFAHSGELEAVP